MKIRTVSMELFEWDQVVALCDLRLSGPVRVDALGQDDVDYDEDVVVVLSRPDGFTMALGGHIVALKPDSFGSSMIPVVELTTFSHLRARALRALAEPNPCAAQRLSMAPRPTPVATASVRHDVPAPSRARKVSEILLGNRRLHAQIEQLAGQMLAVAADDADDDPS